MSKKKREDKFIEEEFNKGNIILPTDLRDYIDFEEFEYYTSHIPRIQDKIKRIKEKNRK